MMGAGVSYRSRPLSRGPISVEDFFGLREDPFSLTPNPRFLHRTRQAHETLGRLTRGILDRKGLILLSGGVGTGKTTLLYTALHLMDVSPAVQNKIGMAVIVHPTLTRDEFLEAVLDEFDVPCLSTRRQRRLEALLKMLLYVRRKGGLAVLVIDEAQLLTVGLLDEIRELLNLQTSHEKLLQIVLCGQPEIEAKLARTNPNLRRGEPFVAIRCNTSPLSLKDTHEYVQHRLRISGAYSDAIFTPEAVNSIHALTNGVPRLINLLCAHALYDAATERSARVAPDMIDLAAAKIFGALTSAPRVPESPQEPLSLVPESEHTEEADPPRPSDFQPELLQASAAPPDLAHPDLAQPNIVSADEAQTTAAQVEVAPPKQAPSAAPPVDTAAARQASRKQKRAARHRAKLGRAAKNGQADTRPTVQQERGQSDGPSATTTRASQRMAIAKVAESLPGWNEWLNRWCSENFTGKNCGRPLFQLGLAGTLLLALAQVVGFGSREQHLAHVAFGFLGMIFVDVSLGLGTYLLLLQRGRAPEGRGGWAQTLLDSWWTLCRRLG